MHFNPMKVLLMAFEILLKIHSAYCVVFIKITSLADVMNRCKKRKKKGWFWIDINEMKAYMRLLHICKAIFTICDQSCIHNFRLYKQTKRIEATKTRILKTFVYNWDIAIVRRFKKLFPRDLKSNQKWIQFCT